MIGGRRLLISDAATIVPLIAADDPHRRTVMTLESEIIATPEPWLITWDGAPAAAFGVIPLDHAARTATCWLLTTTAARAGALRLARESRAVWRAMRAPWREVRGCAPALKPSGARWLRALEFTIEPEQDGVSEFFWTADDGGADNVHRP